MNKGEPLQQRHHHPQQIVFSEGTACRFTVGQHPLKRETIFVIHDEVGGAIGSEEVPTGHNAVVAVQFDQRTGLVAESSQTVGEISAVVAWAHSHALAHGQFDWQVLLDCHRQAQFSMPSAIYNSEAPVADDGIKGVAPHVCTLRQGAPSLMIGSRHRPSVAPE